MAGLNRILFYVYGAHCRMKYSASKYYLKRVVCVYCHFQKCSGFIMTTFLIWEDNLDSYNELSVETSGIA
jgi:hypothetical protein